MKHFCPIHRAEWDCAMACRGYDYESPCLRCRKAAEQAARPVPARPRSAPLDIHPGAIPIQPTWATPQLREQSLCDNCDGAPDGGHTADEVCRITVEAD